MKDFGIDSGLVKKFYTEQKQYGGFYGFRKMFWRYLGKLNVPFYDPCCTTAESVFSAATGFPVQFNLTANHLQYYNGTAWTNVPQL